MSEFISMLVKAPRYLPLLILIVAMLPAWLSWLFLSEKRQESALKMVRELRSWAVGDAGASELSGNALPPKACRDDARIESRTKPEARTSRCGRCGRLGDGA